MQFRLITLSIAALLATGVFSAPAGARVEHRDLAARDDDFDMGQCMKNCHDNAFKCYQQCKGH
ncbi:hypothetical protein VKT23_009737 [Stygiomarasmius scandens]|uniref:Uncharacterized protein n=1 Tax=Marasmiellus scandens TaxID=2682957 RepID=A0ABR1JFZ0_9AGAR